MIKRTVYQCEHCKKFKRTPKIYFKSTDMYYHEASCFYNTQRKTCFTCKHNNRHYNQKLDKYIGCDLGWIEFETCVFVDCIVENCEKWELKEDNNGN